MAQEDPLIRDLRAELGRANALNLSVFKALRSAKVPVGRTTLYRWLNGQAIPRLDRLRATISALRAYLDDEQRRYARGFNTRGGVVCLDAEFRQATRDAKVAPLKGQEFKIFEALFSAKRPLRRDWICDQYQVPEKSFDRALSALREKIKELDLEIFLRSTDDGEPIGYAISDKCGNNMGLAA